MATIALMVGGAITNALAFSGSNFLFSQMSGAEERKRHNLAMEKLQHERDTWNEERLQRIDYINEELKKEVMQLKLFKMLTKRCNNITEVVRIRQACVGLPSPFSQIIVALTLLPLLNIVHCLAVFIFGDFYELFSVKASENSM